MTAIWVLLAVNFMVFVATFIAPEGLYLLGLRPALLASRPWTIISSMFAHASLWHLIGNMITLFFFGSYLLRLVGEVRFLIVYFVGGLVGNALFILLANPLSIAVGASGAVFALGGALAVMRPKLKIMIFPLPIPMNLWIAVIGGFLLISFMPGVGWQAHLGGLLVGLISGYIFRRKERATVWR